MNQIMHATARPGALLPQLFDSVLRIGFYFPVRVPLQKGARYA